MVPPGAYPMAFAQGDMSFAQTPDGMPYLAYPQQTLPGFWPQPNQSNRLNDPSQQNMMYYGQQPTAADFNGMNMMMGMNMMGMNAGGIMTPHGFIPAGNPALQLGYQQMGNGMTMPNATGSVFMHPQNNRSNHAAHNSHSNMKHDHQDNQSNSSGNSNRRSNSNNPPNGGRNNSGNSSGRSSNQNSQAHAAASRDLLVEDFRNTYGKTKQWEIKDLVGHVVAFCQDQHGSRFIQQRLEVAPESDKQIIFKEVLPNAHPLMTDVFGNYVIQKLFEFGTPEQCETLAALLTGQAVTLALQMYGCRVIQKALEYVQTPRLIILISEFEGQQVLRCVHDQNGNHVIQKCIEVISRVAKDSPAETSEFLNSRIQFIIQSFKGRVRELSIHPYGCRVIQRILEYCNSEHKMIVLEELRSNCHELIQDQYGNYVIQHVMQHGYDLDKSILLTEVQSKLLEYSQHKFASNVVEKCIQYADKTYRDEIIWTIINVTFDLNNPVDAQTGQCVLENMVRDPYANYVVQKVIDVSNESQRGAIIRYVRENIIQLRRYTYGKHIIVRLEKVSGEKF
jgi:pumilio RNA-binding family